MEEQEVKKQPIMKDSESDPSINWTPDQLHELKNLEYELRRLFIARQIVAEKYQIAELNKAIKDLNT